VINATGLPTIKLSSSDLINACDFMVDSGSGINLIKRKLLRPNIKINYKEILPLKGIASEIVSTLGSAEIPLLEQPIKFHLLSDNTNFPYDGILGNKFLRDKSVNIDYKNKCLRYDYTEIPFIKTEKIHVAEKRSVTPFYVNITNPEKRVGYIPRCFIDENIYLGDAIVTNTNGRAYLKLFNTSEKEYEIEVPYIELQEFEIAEPSDIVETRGHTTTSEIIETREPPVICKSPSRDKILNRVESPIFVKSADVRGLPVLDDSLKSDNLIRLGDNLRNNIRGTRGFPTTSNNKTTNSVSTNSCRIDNPIYFSEFSK